VVPDGSLHLVPFDALVDSGGKYVVESHSLTYAPSATGFFLLTTQERRSRTFSHTLLAVGGVPYGGGELKQVALTRGYDPSNLSDLPASGDEVQAAESAVHGPSNTILLGADATESAFNGQTSRVIATFIWRCTDSPATWTRTGRPCCCAAIRRMAKTVFCRPLRSFKCDSMPTWWFFLHAIQHSVRSRERKASQRCPERFSWLGQIGRLDTVVNR